MKFWSERIEARRGAAWVPWLLLAAGWLIAFSLSCGLTIARSQFAAGPSSGGGMAAALLGQGRQAMAASLYSAADRTFHRGVPNNVTRALENGFFARIAHETSPRGHMHREGASMVEIMPWLWLSLKADPNNVEIWRVAAFWLGTQLGRPDLAHDLLKEAQRRNAFCYPVKLDLARLAVRYERFDEAEREIDAALAFWPRYEVSDEETARFDLAEILIYKALLCELDSRFADAARAIEFILKLFPERVAMNERLTALREGHAPAVPASQLWRDLLRRQDAAHVCDEHDHGGQDDEAHEPSHER